MNTFPLRILSPEGPITDADAVHLRVTAYHGSLGVMAGHAKMISAVVTGPGKVEHTDGTTQWYAFGEGTLEVRDPDVVLLVDFAEAAESLNDAKNRVAQALA